MKFKFRADPEDIFMFVLFAIFLLYIVCIGVLNLSTFATEGYLYGLNPFPAFGPKYIAATLTFYFLAQWIRKIRDIHAGQKKKK